RSSFIGHHPAIRNALFIGAAATAAAWSFPALAPIVPPVASALGVPRRREDDGGVAITFDDGPHPEGTPRILDALRAGDARATFFVCGEQVGRSPSFAADVRAAGHALALHGHRHRVQLRLTPPQIAEDLDRGLAAIEDATGERPAHYRPPLGIFSFPGLRLV